MNMNRTYNARSLVLLGLLLIFSLGCYGGQPPAKTGTATNPVPQAEPLTLQRLQEDTFRYFWETTDAVTGLAPDRYPSDSPASIAAIGFALTAYAIGVEHDYITREQAALRTLTTLRFLSSLPQGPENEGVAGYQGFFYHFLDDQDGLRSQDWEIELSTVDTALLMAGVLFAQSYFDGQSSDDAEIRSLAEGLYQRVNWQWAQNNAPLISLGWLPDTGFLSHDWVGYNEAMLVYILALGSPTHPVESDAWIKWTDHYEDDWGGLDPYEHLTFGPLFGHQYTHIWIDFRDIQDAYMADKKSDYFLNSRMAVRAQRQYAIANPSRWDGYSSEIWGLTACDGPGPFSLQFKGSLRDFRGYSARGVAINHSFDDGTLSPTAVGGSIAFAPDIVIPALQALYDQYGEHIYSEYGFLDAFNPSFRYDVVPESGQVIPGVGWVGSDYIGIDQGPILAMTENFQSELIWTTMKKNPHIRRGLQQAGFTGGWLDNAGGN
jgi:hypothetical protein